MNRRGRPTIDESKRMVPLSMRLTPEDAEYFKSKGGVNWLRSIIAHDRGTQSGGSFFDALKSFLSTKKEQDDGTGEP